MNRYMHPLIEIRECGNFMGKGVFAVMDIAKGTLVASVDPQQFITGQDFMQYDQFQEICYKIQIQDKKILFALYLSFVSLQPETQDSKFSKQKAYFKELPDTMDQLICWSQEELEMLQNQQLKLKIMKKIHKIRTSFEEIKSWLITQIKQRDYISENCLFKKQQDIINIHFSLFLKMYAVIESRNMFYSNHIDEALVPLIEIFNHSKNKQIQAQFRHGKFEAVTLRDIKAGEQLFVEYVNCSNEQIFEWYGFLPDIPPQIVILCQDTNPRKYLIKLYCHMRKLT